MDVLNDRYFDNIYDELRKEKNITKQKSKI